MRWSTRTAVALIAASSAATGLTATASAATWVPGDVFAGIGNSSVNVFDNAGAFKETVTGGAPSTYTTGCAFDAGKDLYSTGFSSHEVVRFDGDPPHSVVTTYPSQAGNGSAESIIFAQNGDFYVGHAAGGKVEKHDASGAFVKTFTTMPHATDWIDLAKDQTTIFYTDEGSEVFRFDTATETPLPDFGNTGNTNYALRLLPPGDGSGGLLVASSAEVKRLDGTGAVVQSYDAPGENSWFALNLDPNGTSFWSGDFGTNNFYRFNIASGAVEVGPIASQAVSGLYGLCLLGEPTAAVPPPPEAPPGPYKEEACGFTISGKTVTGTAAAETITGTAQSDHLSGAEGNDTIRGLEDRDCLFGNQDADQITGDDGGDVIRAGRGKDNVNGNDGDDDIRLQDGADKGKGGPGDDKIKAQGQHHKEGGVDKVNCGSGNDRATVDRWDKVSKNCEHVTVVN
jgi:Ca2+-binding RTX toxin-like protein